MLILMSRRHRLLAIFSLLVAGLLISGCASQVPVANITNENVQTVWPAPPEQPRIRYLGSLKTNNDISKNKKPNLRDKLLGKEQENQLLLKKPYGVHSDSNGRVFVADSANPGLIVFDLKQQSVSYWGETGLGRLSKPVAVTSDAQGNVYVSDVLEKRVVVFDTNGNYRDAYGGKKILESPAGLVFDDFSQRLYVVDVKKHQVLVFDKQGKVQFTIGERGQDTGKFNFPTNLAMDGSGQLYVADTMNFRVQVFNMDGIFVNSFGKNGNGPGDFSRLKGIGVDTEGHIYAVDAAFNNFQVLNQQGQLMIAVGRSGIDPGGFYLPAGIHVDKKNHIFVADQFNQRIQMFEYLAE